MTIASLPKDEELRLLNLKSFDVLGTEAESDFNDLAELTSQFFNCPVALVTLIDSTQQWFKGKTGTVHKSNQRDLSFCSHTILKNEVMVVEDAAKDDRFWDNPAVTELNIRFYAGTPIVSPSGYNVGTICMFDTVAKTFSETQKKALQLLAKQAAKLLELRKKNLLIREHAEEIITQKTNLLNGVLKMHEDDEKLIAYKLHENLAQEIASSLLYIKNAENDDTQRAASLTTAKKQLEVALLNIKKLSNSIVPTTANFLPVQDLVAEYIKKIAPAFSFAVTVTVEEKNELANIDLVQIAMRIIEEWFKQLAQNSTITNVAVLLKITDWFEISIEDNSPELDIKVKDKSIQASLLYERVLGHGGEVELLTTGNGKNFLKVTLPLMTDTGSFSINHG